MAAKGGIAPKMLDFAGLSVCFLCVSHQPAQSQTRPAYKLSQGPTALLEVAGVTPVEESSWYSNWRDKSLCKNVYNVSGAGSQGW